ncbi:MAG: hypothetical protein ABW007_20205 [Chitinophagaceae bacterium]
MKLRLKDLLVLINTSSLAGIMVYLKYPDRNAAMICGLAVFIVCITIQLVQKIIWGGRSRNY